MLVRPVYIEFYLLKDVKCIIFFVTIQLSINFLIFFPDI